MNCDICSGKAEPSYSALVADVSVCHDCAEKVANAYNFAHSGQWLTWFSQDAKKPHRKAKIPQALRTKVFERDFYRCVTCSTHLNLSIDHIYPESKGGETTFENLQTMCMPCNAKKGAK